MKWAGPLESMRKVRNTYEILDRKPVSPALLQDISAG